MTTDLWMLVASVGLTWALMLAAATPTLLAKPLWSLGPRDEPLEPPGKLQARLKRASRNMEENLPLFAALVLVAHVTGKADATTAMGAQVFLAARGAHALLYVAGVPFVRTLAWAVSVAGMAMIVSALL